MGQTAEGSQPLPFSSLHSELLHFTDNSGKLTELGIFVRAPEFY